MQPRRGFALAQILVLLMVCLVLAFTVATISTFQLQAEQKTQSSEQALFLAEGAISVAMSRLHDGLTGAGPVLGPTSPDIVYAPYASRPDAKGQVTFNAGSAWGYSTNNATPSPIVGWNGVSVPGFSCHLVGQGVFGPSVRTVEAFVDVPVYPYVVASNSDIQSTTPLLASAEPSMAQLATDVGHGIAPVMPASVAANGSISAGSGTLVTGDVIASGTVNLASPSQVGGVIRKGVVQVPAIPVASFRNPALAQPIPTPDTYGNISLVASTYSGSSQILNGNVILSSALLYVDGDLTINGALTGSGAVCVHGNFTLNGGASVNASFLVAVLATGDITMTGANTSQYFQGLVYSEGAFTASNLTVAGAMVTNHTAEATSSHQGVTLTNAPLVYVPSAVNMTVGGLGLAGSGGNNINTPISSETANFLTEVTPSTPALLAVATNALASNPKALPALDVNGQPLLISRVICQWTTPTGVSLSQAGSLMVYTNYYEPRINQFIPITPPAIALTPAAAYNATNLNSPGFDWSTSPNFAADIAAYNVAAAAQGLPDYATTLCTIEATQMAVMNAANANPGTWCLGLNNFLSDTSPLHITSWREH